MENKEYYTPSEEELFIGYSCQRRVKTHLIQGLNGKSSGYLDRELNNWKDFIITPKYWQGGFSESTGFADYELDLRTPYLCKQDIIDLGWKEMGKSIDIWFYKEGTFDMGSFTTYKIIMHYGLKDHRMFIYAEDQGTEYDLFKGEIKSINEFRKLSKWLGI